jgi:hypothetical protein
MLRALADHGQETQSAAVASSGLSGADRVIVSPMLSLMKARS